MTPGDAQYFSTILDRGLIRGPCLELGAGIPEHSVRQMVLDRGIEYFATDIQGDVDFRIDFERDPQAIRASIGSDLCFGSAIVFNVLEHTFDPIRVLDNVFSILKPGATCAVLTPTVWPNHSYPIDCWRILPDFYLEYVQRRGHRILDGTFQYIRHGALPSVRRNGFEIALPTPGRSRYHWLYSRAVHKLFNTAGRGMLFPSHVATAVVFEKAG